MAVAKRQGREKPAEIDVFLELSCIFHDPADVGIGKRSPKWWWLKDKEGKGPRR